MAVCGDGAVQPGEACDDGNMADGDGCDNDCTLSCVDAAADCPDPPTCQAAACSATATCAPVPDPTQNGADCGAGMVCKDGACAAPVCGDGAVEGMEQCDFGAGNGPGTGCEATCVFSCTKSPDSCPDMEACNGVEVCTTVIVGGNTGQACAPGMPLLDCSACAGGVCGAGMCNASMCGDGCVDAAAGEQCEPPSSPTCDAMCKNVVMNPCGNGVRDMGEQCDDGNTQNLDGCDATCKFEQDHRSNYLLMQFGLDAFCGNANQLGSAVSMAAQGAVQQALTNGVAAGTSGFAFKMLGLESLTGADDAALELGVVTALPVMGAGYNGSNDLDWWYTANAAQIDASRSPLDKLPASITAGTLSAGPGSMFVSTNFFASQTTLLRLSSAKMQVTVGASSAPLTSAGMPPGHLASEHLDPALMSSASMGSKDAMGSGKLCGNVSAKSLAQAPVPAELLPGGTFACTQAYTAANSLLDVIVNGCNIVFMGFPVQAMVARQPDKVDPGMPAAGAGGPYSLAVNAQKIVSTCNDSAMASVDLNTCLNAAAYSSYFRFATGRVILK
jgi:cysteine-rich repeat protein